MKIRYLDTFAGVGGFHLALEQSIGKENIECIGYSEIDKFCKQVYEKRFPGSKDLGSITELDIDNLPDFDLLTGGFPCQDVSVAGKQNLEGGRTILVEYLLQILEKKQPQYFIFENVKGFMGKKFTEFRESIFKRIQKAGYYFSYDILNTKNFGLPQNRERVFIVGHREVNPIFNFPSKQTDGKIITHIQNKQVVKRVHKVNIEGLKQLLRNNRKPIIEIANHLDIPKTTVEHYFRKDKCFAIPNKDIWLKLKTYLGITTNEFDKSIMEFEIVDGVFEKGNRVYDINGIAPTLTTGGELTITNIFNFPQCQELTTFLKDILEEEVDEKYYMTEKQYNSLSYDSIKRIYSTISPTLNTSQGGHRQPKILFNKFNNRIIENVSGTLGTGAGFTNKQGYMVCDTINKQLSIRKLTPTEYARLQGFPDDWNDNVSNSQRYKQMGNAISVPVVKALFDNLLKGKIK